ncbi:hypothetical protein C8T65DRAFT_666911 [Cerioporus squamosus]|nr:hypothetical protein C8T65DRAFT_666911 [Cerioporus squamosus]
MVVSLGARTPQLSPTNSSTPVAGLPPGAQIPTIPPLDDTYGALLLGMSFGLMLYGLTVHQAYRYFRMYPRDIGLLKGFVLTLLALETLHTACSIIACYYHLVSNFANPQTLLRSHWSTQLLTPICGFTIILCQGFYARRVYLVGPQYRPLVVIAVVCMFVLSGFTIGATVEGFLLTDLRDFQRVNWMISCLFGIGVFTDAILTGALVWVLRKSRTGIKQTDSTVDIIIAYAINTGLLNSILGLAGFLVVLISPGNFIYISIAIVFVKVYANCVLTSLNSRRSLSTRIMEDVHLGSMAWNKGRSAARHTKMEAWDVPGVSHAPSTMVFMPADESSGATTTVEERMSKDHAAKDLSAGSL